MGHLGELSNSLPDPHPSEGLAEGDEPVLAPPAPLSHLTPEEFAFWAPAIQEYRQAQEALSLAQQKLQQSIGTIDFLVRFFTPKYQIQESDRISEDGEIVRGT